MVTASLEEPGLLPSHFQTLFLNSIESLYGVYLEATGISCFSAFLAVNPSWEVMVFALSIPMDGSLNQYDYRSQSLLLDILACW
jgi:hypothetical protein